MTLKKALRQFDLFAHVFVFIFKTTWCFIYLWIFFVKKEEIKNMQTCRESLMILLWAHVFLYRNRFGLIFGVLTNKKMSKGDTVRVNIGKVCTRVARWLVGIFCGKFLETNYLISCYLFGFHLNFICRIFNFICIEDFMQIKYCDFIKYLIWFSFCNYHDLMRWYSNLFFFIYLL